MPFTTTKLGLSFFILMPSLSMNLFKAVLALPTDIYDAIRASPLQNTLLLFPRWADGLKKEKL